MYNAKRVRKQRMRVNMKRKRHTRAESLAIPTTAEVRRRSFTTYRDCNA